jgi:hypothetical protein
MLAAAGAIERVMTTADSKMAKISLRMCAAPPLKGMPRVSFELTTTVNSWAVWGRGLRFAELPGYKSKGGPVHVRC